MNNLEIIFRSKEWDSVMSEKNSALLFEIERSYPKKKYHYTMSPFEIAKHMYQRLEGKTAKQCWVIVLDKILSKEIHDRDVLISLLAEAFVVSENGFSPAQHTDLMFQYTPPGIFVYPPNAFKIGQCLGGGKVIGFVVKYSDGRIQNVLEEDLPKSGFTSRM